MLLEGSFQLDKRPCRTAVRGPEALRCCLGRKGEHARGTAVEMQRAGFLMGIHQDLLAHAQVDLAANYSYRLLWIERTTRGVVEYPRHTQIGNVLRLGAQGACGTAESERLAVGDAIDAGG